MSDGPSPLPEGRAARCKYDALCTLADGHVGLHYDARDGAAWGDDGTPWAPALPEGRADGRTWADPPKWLLREYDVGPTLADACEILHDAYEAAAAGHGWATQEASRKPWSEVPYENQSTMLSAMAKFLGWLRETGWPGKTSWPAAPVVAVPGIDPDKPMRARRVVIDLETQLTDDALTELTYRFTEQPGIGCAGFNIEEIKP